jgi:CubicO group peptidase (beta-lactamase class C family)
MLKRRLSALPWMLLLLLPTLAMAASLDIEAPMQQFLTTSGAPGVAVSVLARGQDQPVTFARGQACLNHGVAIGPHEVMRLGSVTKAFTGVRIKMLIEEGKLGYDTPISRFFPDFPKADAITIRHLLTHTSGMPEMLRMKAFVTDMAGPWPPRRLLDLVAKQPFLFAPGTGQEYCNTGYLMLGLIIEAVTGDAFAHQIRAQVAQPLGMTSLRAGDDSTLIENEACGYRGDKSGTLFKPYLASLLPPLGTGNLIGTSEDIVRLVHQGRLLKDNPLDHPPTGPYRLDNGKMTQKHEQFLDLAYDSSFVEGLTSFRFSDRDMNLIGKSGMFPGFASWFLYDSATRTAVGVTTNLETACSAAMQLAVRTLEEVRRVTPPQTAP